jgi:hypothetical protein
LIFGHAKPGWNDVFTRQGESYERLMDLRISAQTMFLKHRAHEQIQSALRARTRKLTVYEPGQNVMVWRTGKGTKTKPGKDGKWLGPAVVLKHHRNSNGTFGKIVWISLGGRLYRAAPEHLRPTTERETLMFETTYPKMSINPTDLLNKGEFEDLADQPLPTPEDHDMGDNVLEPEIISEVPTEPSSSSNTPSVPRRKRIGKQPENPDNPETKSRRVVQLVYHVDQDDINKYFKDPSSSDDEDFNF